jgi:hypothetical protein
MKSKTNKKKSEVEKPQIILFITTRTTNKIIWQVPPRQTMPSKERPKLASAFAAFQPSIIIILAYIYDVYLRPPTFHLRSSLSQPLS